MPMAAAAQFAIQQATDSLLELFLSAKGANNSNFLSTYNQVLLQMLPPVLEGHLLSRIAASIVLSQTGVPEAVDVFLKQLNNPEQTVWVDLWAARGLTNIQQMGRYNLDAARAIRAAKTVADFLEREKELPWPVQYRALEALGSLRRANTPQMQKGQPEMAGTAAQFLTDPEGRVEVRTEAGWALGMMEIPAGINGYNFPMIAYSVGELAAMLGDRIREIYPKNPTQAEAWTGLLVTQILQTFDGIDAARDSGLLKSTHPAAAQARPFIKQVSDKIKPVAAAAVKLVRDPQGRAAHEPQGTRGQDRRTEGTAPEESARQHVARPQRAPVSGGGCPGRQGTSKRRASGRRTGRSPEAMTAPADDDRSVPDSARAFPAAPSMVLSIPEIRDYQRINAELSQQLDEGHTHVRLVGAEGQRLLLAGVAGAWSALVEIEGDVRAGARRRARCAGLTVVARGPTADGAGARLRAGRLILLGDTGDALGSGQEGGVILAAAAAGHRAGLGQRGGVLVVLGPLGRLAGERQDGGRLFVHAAPARPSRRPRPPRRCSCSGSSSATDLAPARRGRRDLTGRHPPQGRASGSRIRFSAT